ncbi:Uma2 family endonuclease [Nodosilinea sp. P-1105]|uniref:Uma2 family endonuclease n=1 Tax=Nodosilinea sp. P-1105 TaxID=2546229 RepID=UPI00146C623D|nr:Uma2 family endonuclease [Nodosilinea sp. P-1105]NMF84424.1 Uma2 family endonuclease [Nodosilinea sp. P-1105]
MVQSPSPPQVLYPDADGQPMADNTLQYRWIVRLVSNLRRLLHDQQGFVAGDLLWYPVQVDTPPVPAQAPDVMVVIGRPSGERGSYKQWKEANIAPQVVFEILSPSNTAREMLAKQAFYGKYGVLEMIFYDPDSFEFWALVRPSPDRDFTPIMAINFPWVSPTLGIRFELWETGLEVFYPNGDRFQDPEVVLAERDLAFAKLRELGIDPTQL